MGRTKLLHEELTYRIRGILYKVHNELGQYRNEKQYADAIEHELQKLNIPYKKEAILPVSFAGEKEGRNRVDFIIDNKIILEIKVVPSFSRNDYWQCQRYLISSGKDLALLVNFNLSSCIIKRILNPKMLKQKDNQ